jgi:hypothetical protein
MQTNEPPQWTTKSTICTILLFSRRFLVQQMKGSFPHTGYFTEIQKQHAVKYKAHLVAHGFTQVPGVEYCELYLYAPRVHLESFRIFISITMLFDFRLCQFDMSTGYLHGEIDGEVYIEPPPGYQKDGAIWQLQKGPYKPKQTVGRLHLA